MHYETKTYAPRPMPRKRNRPVHHHRGAQALLLPWAEGMWQCEKK